MLKAILLVFLWLSIPQAAWCQLGVSFLAIQAFNAKQCQRALGVFDGINNPGLSILWGSFGSDNSCIASFIGLAGKRTIEIHATNETCRRPPRHCTKYDQPDFKTRIREISRYIQANATSGTSWIVSTGLEDDYSRDKYARRYAMAREGLPDFVKVSRNPNIKSKFILKADILERHGSPTPLNELQGRAGHCAWSNDGQPLWTADVLTARRLGCKVFAWDDFQGISSSKKYIEPRKRKITISIDDITRINAILLKVQLYEHILRRT